MMPPALVVIALAKLENLKAIHNGGVYPLPTPEVVIALVKLINFVFWGNTKTTENPLLLSFNNHEHIFKSSLLDIL